MKGDLTPFFAAAIAEANCGLPVTPPSGNACRDVSLNTKACQGKMVLFDAILIS